MPSITTPTLLLEQDSRDVCCSDDSTQPNNSDLMKREKLADLGLVNQVRRGLGNHLGIAPEQIHIPLNKEKYYDQENANVASSELQEVFCLMKRLNEEALDDDTVGAAPDGSGGNFRDTLARTAKDVATHMEGREFLYVEMGPEPTKTVFFLRKLLECGARIRRYIGVDINPASRQTMQEALTDVLGRERVVHCLSSFDDFCVDDYRDDDMPPALVTTLGFQEGNEDPTSLQELYRNLLAPGDLLLSEMQLRSTEDSDEDDRSIHFPQVQSFYRHPLMQRFSRITFQRFHGHDTPSQAGMALVDVGRYGEEDLWAAVLFEMPKYESSHSKGVLPLVFVTNYCVKYTRRQFRELRHSSACQKVPLENLTGDGSVVFQLSAVRKM